MALPNGDVDRRVIGLGGGVVWGFAQSFWGNDDYSIETRG